MWMDDYWYLDIIQVPSDISSKDEQSENQVSTYILFSAWDSKGEILKSIGKECLSLQGGVSSGDNNASSSSKMISFDFANGDPFVPHVPTASIDEDDYVEYPLDNLADFPSNVEEEERVSRFF